MDSFSPSPAPADLRESLTSLRPIFEFDQIVSHVLTDMGLGTARVSSDDAPLSGTEPGLTVLHFLILPQRSAWLDFMLEADHASAQRVFQHFTGDATTSADDLADILRECMNMIQGGLKRSFHDAGVDVIIPLVPQSIAPEKLSGSPGGYSMQSRFTFSLEGITLRLTMIARVAPITQKELRNFRLAEVLLDPVAPPDDDAHPVVKPHTLLNKRLLAQVRAMPGAASDTQRRAVIEPSPWAELLPND